MRFKAKSCIIFGVLLMGLNCFPPIAQADSTINFGVQAEIPENQIDKKQTYFDLQMSAGKKETIYVDVSNPTNSKVTVEVEVNSATTNDNGIIDYSEGNKKSDKTLKYDMKDIVKYDKEFQLAPKETKKVPIEITMPEATYDGIILGGINFQQKETEVSATENEEKDKSMVENRYSYIIGLKLTETTNEVTPDMKLKSIKPGQYNYANYVKVNLQNPTSTMISNLKIDGKVYKDGSKEVLHETKKEKLSMAPNSNFNYKIDWENQAFKSGNYRLKMTATDGEHTWKWDEQFTIDKKDAQKYNNQAVNLEKDYTWLYIVLGVIGLLLLLLLVFLLGRRSSKKKEQGIKEKETKE
ncbi:DUF916 and DUF3324 domain-containing protein [Listeria seeligeri]|uniref:DUF916 and DUF3324 domain-containing protein n=1 Tax=Listeria seeligeri TaxID=1640 RepID=UPI001887AB71|nr:DUF916 and DUF3324 domain-containing protein [Listeria seeligeri]MBF2562617.1 DUF916 and DUF3324 domain-containing protein [Listeria seeligeri]MBF2671114.1 DUF916 and DUF3324 domain-containing protein [Listeria seeligeri]